MLGTERLDAYIVVALCLLFFIFIPWGSRGRCLIRGVSLLPITLTCIVYNFMLYNIFLDWGTVGYTFSRTVTHIIAPLGFILDWFIFDKHSMMKVKDIVIWLIYPVVYCLVFVYIDYHYSFSIYFFLDSANGYAAMIKWLSVLLCALIIISLIYVGLDRVIGHLKDEGRRRRGRGRLIV